MLKIILGVIAISCAGGLFVLAAGLIWVGLDLRAADLGHTKAEVFGWTALILGADFLWIGLRSFLWGWGRIPCPVSLCVDKMTPTSGMLLHDVKDMVDAPHLPLPSVRMMPALAQMALDAVNEEPDERAVRFSVYDRRDILSRRLEDHPEIPSGVREAPFVDLSADNEEDTEVCEKTTCAA